MNVGGNLRPDQSRLMSTEEAMASAIIEMLETSKQKTKTLSDLDDQEIGYMALLQTMGVNLNIKPLRDFVDNFCQFRVSRARMGRREMSHIVAAAGGSLENKMKRKSLGDLFGGMR